MNEDTQTNSTNNSKKKNKNHKSNTNKEQDRFLPIANVGRIMKKVTPNNGKISKEAKETVQECVSEFISFVTGEASDKCQREKRKTINGDDIIWALSTLSFENYVNPLKTYLTKYREFENEKLNVPKQQRSDYSGQSQPQSLLSQQRPRLLHVHDQFQQMDHHGLAPYATSVYSSSSSSGNTSIPQPSFIGIEEPFPLPFSTSSIQKNYQEQIDSVGQW